MTNLTTKQTDKSVKEGMKCKHQFFETSKIQHMYEHETAPPKGEMWIPYSDDTGVQVMCVLCGEQRQVWQSGKLNIYNKKKQIWELL